MNNLIDRAIRFLAWMSVFASPFLLFTMIAFVVLISMESINGVIISTSIFVLGIIIATVFAEMSRRGKQLKLLSKYPVLNKLYKRDEL